MKHSANLLIALALVLASADALAARRLAVIVGNNVGSADREVLRYAERDAQQFRDVIISLGDTEAHFLALGKTSAELDAILDETERRLRADPEPATLVFFYSGHADESALLMQGTRYGFDALRRRLEAMPAKLHIAFVDACQSGQLTRAKGGTMVPIDVDVYRDERNLTGGVFITSSAAGENAQESDELGASFFTHYLVSALRGAADESQDQKVSLEEAYAYVYRQTVDRTRGTLLGAQHPTYSIDVSGQGQLVLTWLSEGQSYLEIPAASLGTYFLRSPAKDALLAEVAKTEQRPVRIAVDPGRYEVSKAEGGYLYSKELEVGVGNKVTLDESQMARRPLSAVYAKGGHTIERRQRLGAGYELGTGYLVDAGVRHGVQLRYGIGVTKSRALELGLVGSYSQSSYVRTDAVDVSLREAGGGLYGQWLFPLGFAQAELYTGLELRAAWVWQEGQRLDQSETRQNAVFPLAARLGASVPLVDPLELSVGGFLGTVLFEGTSRIKASLVGGMQVGLQFRL